VEIDRKAIGAGEDADFDRRPDNRRVGFDAERLARRQNALVRGVGFRTEPTLYIVLLLWLLNQFAFAGVMKMADNRNREPMVCNVFMVYSQVCTAPMKRFDCSGSERELWLQIGEVHLNPL